MKALQLRDLVVKPSLEMIGLWTLASEKLSLGTCAQESQMGEYIAQVRGPALGIFQMEPATYDDLVKNYLNAERNLPLKARILASIYAEVMPGADALAWNMRLAVIMARLLYLRVPEQMPAADDLPGLAAYYKRYYNTPRGAATTQQFIANYTKWVAPIYME